MCPLSTINNIEIHPIEKKLFKPAPLDVILTTTSGWSLHVYFENPMTRGERERVNLVFSFSERKKKVIPNSPRHIILNWRILLEKFGK